MPQHATEGRLMASQARHERKRHDYDKKGGRPWLI
jgi:hypothetical protein